MNEATENLECPECNKKNLKTFLKLYQINLHEAIYMCPIKTCKYPNKYKIIYVKRNIMQDDSRILTEEHKKNVESKPELLDSNSESSVGKINQRITDIKFDENTSEIVNVKNNGEKSDGKIKILSNERVSLPIIDINNIISNCDSRNSTSIQSETNSNVYSETSSNFCAASSNIEKSSHSIKNCANNSDVQMELLNNESADFPVEVNKVKTTLKEDINIKMNSHSNINVNKEKTTDVNKEISKSLNSCSNIETENVVTNTKNSSVNETTNNLTNSKMQIKTIVKHGVHPKVFNKKQVPIKITYPKLHNVKICNQKNNMKNLTGSTKITPQALKTMNKLVNTDKNVKICFIDNSDNLSNYKINTKTKICNRLKLTPEQLSSSISAALAATKEINTPSSVHKKNSYNFKQNLLKKQNTVSNLRVSKFEGFNFESQPESNVNKQNKDNIDGLHNISDFDQIMSTLNTHCNPDNNDSTLNLSTSIDENILNDVLKDVNIETNKNTNIEVDDVDDWLKSLIS